MFSIIQQLIMIIRRALHRSQLPKPQHEDDRITHSMVGYDPFSQERVVWFTVSKRTDIIWFRISFFLDGRRLEFESHASYSDFREHVTNRQRCEFHNTPYCPVRFETPDGGNVVIVISPQGYEPLRIELDYNYLRRLLTRFETNQAT